jgi:hypothetical protein
MRSECTECRRRRESEGSFHRTRSAACYRAGLLPDLESEVEEGSLRLAAMATSFLSRKEVIVQWAKRFVMAVFHNWLDSDQIGGSRPQMHSLRSIRLYCQQRSDGSLCVRIEALLISLKAAVAAARSLLSWEGHQMLNTNAGSRQYAR